MPTLLRTLGVALPASPITVTSVTAAEKALVRVSGLVDWWRADQAATASGWRGRKGDNNATALRGSVPTTTSSGTNSKPYVTASSTCLKTGSGVLPANASFSVLAVARPSSSPGYGAIVGNQGSGSGNFWMGVASGGAFYATIGASAFVNYAGSYNNAAGTKCFIASFRYTDGSTQQGVARVNGTTVGTRVAGSNFSAVSWSDTVLSIFDSGASSFAAWNGELYDVMLFNIALADDSTSLATVEAYVRDRYAIW